MLNKTKEQQKWNIFQDFTTKIHIIQSARLMHNT